IVNHPTDLRFALSSLLASAEQPHSVLFGLINPDEVGIAGHSDGGDVSLAVAQNSCCRDPSVKAIVVLSGAELAAFGGIYFSVSPIPIFVVQGSADTVNVPACSAQIYDGAISPKYYLDLLGAAHEPPYIESGTDEQIVARTTTEFFDAQLKGERRAAAFLQVDGTVEGVSQLTTASTAPPAPGSCPGAPG
ncbi:MAG: hypothetical protein ACRDYB_09705, partial [Acidimicrobiales bacterium]